jgi:ABC-type sugar transport system ATPase subunit
MVACARAQNVALAALFENYALYPHLVVRENLDFALRIHRTPAEEIRRRVSAVAASMELGRLLERKPPGLAAGAAQHVAIGRAVVRDTPAVLLLDDALSHLDAHQRLDARSELGRFHRELRTRRPNSSQACAWTCRPPWSFAHHSRYR